MKVLGLVLLSGVVWGMPGGIYDLTVSENDPEVLFAVEQIQGHLGSPVTLVEIQKAQGQVTGYINYYLTLRMSEDFVCDVRLYSDWSEGGRLKLHEAPSCRQHNLPIVS